MKWTRRAKSWLVGGLTYAAIALFFGVVRHAGWVTLAFFSGAAALWVGMGFVTARREARKTPVITPAE